MIIMYSSSNIKISNWNYGLEIIWNPAKSLNNGEFRYLSQMGWVSYGQAMLKSFPGRSCKVVINKDICDKTRTHSRTSSTYFLCICTIQSYCFRVPILVVKVWFIFNCWYEIQFINKKLRRRIWRKWIKRRKIIRRN